MLTTSKLSRITNAVEEAVWGAIGIIEGECLAQVRDENGEFIQEIGFRIQNENQDGTFSLCHFDEETETETTVKYKITVECRQLLSTHD